MIDDHPTAVALPIDEAESSWNRHRLPVADIGKGVVPGIHRHVAVYPNTLVSQRHSALRLIGHALEVIAKGFGGIPQGRETVPQRTASPS